MNKTNVIDYTALYRFILDYRAAHGGNMPPPRLVKKEFAIKSRSHLWYIIERKFIAPGLMSLPKSLHGQHDWYALEIVGARWIEPESVKIQTSEGHPA